MNADIKDKLTEAGVDLPRTLQRFMNNEPLYEKFLVKFLEDENYALLEKSIQEKDYAAAEQAAHTLKGVTGNLGLDPLFHLLTAIVSDLRSQKYDTLGTQFEAVKEPYEVFCGILKDL